MFPIPDLHEGRETASIVDDLLRQRTDEIVKNSQPVRRYMVNAPGHLRFSKERQERRPRLWVRFVGGQSPKIDMIKMLRPWKCGMFSITFRNTDQVDELKERLTREGREPGGLENLVRGPW